MTMLHPSRAGSRIAMWFVDGAPVRLVSGAARFRVLDEPKCADINGCRYWRIRAQGDDGRVVMLDVREAEDGWVLAGVDEDAARTDRR